MNRRTVAALVAAAAVALAGCASDAGAPARSAQVTPSATRTLSQSGVSQSGVSQSGVSPAGVSPSAVLAAPAPASSPAASRVAIPTASTATPCAHNATGQLVRVKLDVQRMWLCTGHRLDRETPITSGIPGQYTSTPTGTYTVQALTRNTTLTLISGQSYAVKYWIPFDSPLFGFHDSSWQDFPYGSQKYRTEGSHGCVHMPLAAIQFLYHWADIGAKVRITA